MTPAQLDRLIAWLHEGVDVLRTFLQDAPQSRLEPDTDDLSFPPTSLVTEEALRAAMEARDAAVAEQLAPRKRGRPKGSKNKTQGEKVQASAGALTITPVEVGSFPDETQPLASTCRYCERFIPTSAIKIHEENCRADKTGYATHQA